MYRGCVIPLLLDDRGGRGKGNGRVWNLRNSFSLVAIRVSTCRSPNVGNGSRSSRMGRRDSQLPGSNRVSHTGRS